MRRTLSVALLIVSFLQCGSAVSAGTSVATDGAAAPAITRRDGFLRIWASIQRPSNDTREVSYADVPEESEGYLDITYAKYRGILDDTETFRPDDPLLLSDGLLWLFRTRSVADIDDLTTESLPALLERYGIAKLEGHEGKELTEEELLTLMRNLDESLASEEHEISLYGEKFHGKGTAFGETFDMNALTAAHRTFPWNTLVRVTNVDNGKSVTVRINDRGPYVEGRDMDLSVAAFTTIAAREKGVIHATFQRLGDAAIVGPCVNAATYQTRIGKELRLSPGVPHYLQGGAALNLHAPQPFVVRSVRYPDGNETRILDWVLPGENYRFMPALSGTYTFLIGTPAGRQREMEMNVVECSS
ncbi:MAG: septal ring lytic transglycosylase RlpA family protein [Candidatus Peribacteraceae bacterium]|jgi:hypothetical protein